MRWLRQFAAFWYDFVVGDDWRAAAAVVVALAVTKAVAGTSVAAWWVLPISVAVSLPLSIRRLLRGGAGERAIEPE
jgi:hypothetical protein